jgi:outer membrane lipoprotein-sorting protein
LLTAVQQSTVTAFSGTIVHSAKLGLPSLPEGFGGNGSLSLQSLLTGTHTLRVWVDGPDRQRVALLGRLSEMDAVHNGQDLWTYDSQTLKVTHASAPTQTAKETAKEQTTASTPAQVAAQALNAIDPTTAVSVDRTARVAGRPAYQLVLTPRDARTLIGRVQVAIDSKTSVPLRVEVFARGGGAAALQVGFTHVNFGTPDTSVFRFRPPHGSTVTQRTIPGLAASDAPAEPSKPSAKVDKAHGTGSPVVLGSGWTAVAEVSGAMGKLDNATSKLLDHMSTRVAQGRLITTSLLSVLLTDDGRVFVGSVSGESLQKVVATGRAL